jgi:hypothetical protein
LLIYKLYKNYHIDNYHSLCYYVIVMKLTNTIKNKFFEYNQNEFMPVYQDGELANKNQFLAYKGSQMVRGIGRNGVRVISLLQQVGEHAAQG